VPPPPCAEAATIGGERVTWGHMQITQLSSVEEFRPPPPTRLSAVATRAVKMADGENILGGARSSAAAETDEPAAKKPKTNATIPDDGKVRAADAETVSRVSEATGGWGPSAVNPAPPPPAAAAAAAEEEEEEVERAAEPAMAVEQAPVALAGGDNGVARLVPEPDGKADVKLYESSAPGTVGETAGTRFAHTGPCVPVRVYMAYYFNVPVRQLASKELTWLAG